MLILRLENAQSAPLYPPGSDSRVALLAACYTSFYPPMKLSILMPVYNERTVVERSISLVLTAPLPERMERELVIVDDCSTDGTFQILKRLAEAHPEIRLFRHEKNAGKGAAVRSAIAEAQGDFALIQDADLEYDPSEYPRLLQPLLEGHADAVFGSRYLAGGQMRVLPFWHSMINKGLTLVSNMFCNLNLTDMETCYKVFRTDLLKSVPIRSNRFGFEPEITMKSAKRKFRIYEVPISYHGRTYEEGKKIGWKDGVKALAVVVHFWLIDDLYAAPYGRGVLNNLTGTPQYLSWMARASVRTWGTRCWRWGRESGTSPGRLMARRLLYVAAENDPLHVHALRNRFLRTPNVEVRRLDPRNAAELAALGESFDTVLCLNVLGVYGGSGGGARIAAADAKARRLAGDAGAAGAGALRAHRSRTRAQAAFQHGGSAGPARSGRFPGGEAVPVQPRRHVPLVDVREDFRLRQDQQAGVENFR